MAFVRGIHAGGEAAHVLFDVIGADALALGAFQAARDVGQRLLDAMEAAVESGLGIARFQLGDVLFEPRHGAGVLRLVGRQPGAEPVDRVIDLRQRGRLALDLAQLAGLGGVRGFDAFDGLFQRVGAGVRRAFDGADALVDHGDALFERARSVFGFAARVAEAPGDGFDVVGKRGDLRGGLARRVGNLVGEARQALMQRLHGVAQSVRRGGAFDAGEAFGQADDVAAQLVEGLRLFAGGDVDLGGRLAHGAAVLGLAALGRVEAAGEGAHLVFGALVDALALVLRAGDAGQHVLGVLRRGGYLVHGGDAIGGGRCRAP